jgi:phenylpropionate dioxygenase-like ring-hydroxylating dioxygenase large terminal subunit
MVAARTYAAWTPISVSNPQKSPQRVQLHGQQKTLYWKDHTTPLVVDDACSHRGASLALGQVTPDGCVQCGYHGKKTRGNPRRTRDVDGIVWYRDGFESSDRDIPRPWEFTDPSQRIFSYTESFPETNPLMMVENTLDYAHLSFVHAFSVADGEPIVVVDSENNTAQYIYDTAIDCQTLIVENQFWAPWTTCLRFYLNKTHLFSLHFAWIPRSQNSTDLVVRVTRTHFHWTGDIGDRLLQIANTLPLIEDRDIVQSIHEDRTWSDDVLQYEDRFLRLYREAVMRDFPEIADLYM